MFVLKLSGIQRYLITTLLKKLTKVVCREQCSKNMAHLSLHAWVKEKRFYTRETIRGIRISLFAKIPTLYHDWPISLN